MGCHANDLTTASGFPRDDIQRLWRAFDPLSFERRSRALRLGAIEVAHGGDMFRPGDEIAVVLSGCLLLQVEGTKICVGVAVAGDLIDFGGGTPGRWLVAGSFYRAPLARFLGEAGDEGLRFLLSAGARRTRRVEARMSCAMTHPALSRVASLLLETSEACDGIDVHLCQAGIGEMLSLQRTSINGACQLLRAAGAIRTMRGRSVVLDRAALRRQACCGRDAVALDQSGLQHEHGGLKVGTKAASVA